MLLKARPEQQRINEILIFDRLALNRIPIVTHKGVAMKFITVRDLRGRSGQVWAKLAREREVILTSNGKPIAILSAVSEETLEESLAAVRQARVVAAVEKMQRQSIHAGTDSLSSRDIEAEIKAVRKARRR
jgi:antitoxin (DNA-binding transcriptional repressor) of toxin-antitoxin stability system